MKSFKLLFLVILISLTGCGEKNVIASYSTNSSDEGKHHEAKKLLNASRWLEAIAIIEEDMTTSYAARVEVKETLASAYAGACGYTFATILTGLLDATSTQVFPLFFSIFSDTGTTIDVTKCDKAISILQNLGTVTERTNNQNLFLSILGIARIGTTLVERLQDSGTMQVHAQADVCYGNPLSSLPLPTPAPPAYLRAEDVERVATGLGLIFENRSALNSLLGSGTNSMQGLDDALASCALVAGSESQCIVTDMSSVDSSLNTLMRMMLDTADYGFSNCDLSVTTPGSPGFCCDP